MKLNIGGQKGRWKQGRSENHAGDVNFSGWHMVDTRKGAEFRLNVMEKPLPIKNNSVDAIYCSHTLEHIFPDRLFFVLKEWNRVLKPNQFVRIVVPDMRKGVKAYLDGDVDFLRRKGSPEKEEFLPSLPLCYLNVWFMSYKIKDGKRTKGGHVVAFDFDVLEHYLQGSGFKNIVERSYEEKQKVFSSCDFAWYQGHSLYVEATKS